MNAHGLKKVGLSLLLFVSLSFLYYGYYIKQQLNKPLDIGTNAVIFEVKSNESTRSIINRLYKLHYIHDKTPLKIYTRYYQMNPFLKAGIYEIKPFESAPLFFSKVIKGDVLTLSLRIGEGSNLAELQRIFKTASYLNFNLSDFNEIKGEHLNAEGLMLADTYQYRALSDARQIIKLAHLHLESFLTEQWAQRDKSLPYSSPYEMLIAASIIEKESGVPRERNLISGVIMNRLNKKMPLQMDPTVIYGLGDKYQGKLHHNDMKFDSPYNTYIYRGLPPTPIAMVGKASIIAAAHPTKTDYLYFVAKGDGTHEFSSTYDAQRKAIYQYHHQGIQH